MSSCLTLFSLPPFKDRVIMDSGKTIQVSKQVFLMKTHIGLHFIPLSSKARWNKWYAENQQIQAILVKRALGPLRKNPFHSHLFCLGDLASALLQTTTVALYHGRRGAVSWSTHILWPLKDIPLTKWTVTFCNTSSFQIGLKWRRQREGSK